MAEDDPNTLVNPFTGQVLRLVEITDEHLVMESTYQAGGAPAPPHFHPSQEERFEVIEGGVRANVEGDERILRPTGGGETEDDERRETERGSEGASHEILRAGL